MIDLNCKHCKEDKNHIYNGRMIGEKEAFQNPELTKYYYLHLVTCLECKNTYTIEESEIEKILRGKLCGY